MRSSSNRSSRSRAAAVNFNDGQQQPPSSRGDSATAASRESYHHHYQQDRRRQSSVAEDKFSHGPGSSGCCSRADELSRLELRLAAMESRLSDFEAMLQQRSCTSGTTRSMSGDCNSQWPDSSATMGGGDLMGMGVNNGSAMASASGSVETTEEARLTGKRPMSRCDPSPLNLVFSTENDDSDDKLTSTSSTTWTDLDLKGAEFNGQLIRSLNDACCPGKTQHTPDQQQNQQQQNQQQQKQRQQQPVSPKAAAVASTESFEITRYSTQESVVYQERYELATHFSQIGMECADAAAAEALLATGGGGSALRRQQEQQQRQLMLLQASNCQLLTTTLAERAEPLPAPPSGRQGGRVVIETGSPRALVEPAASAEKCSRGGDGEAGRGDVSSGSSSWQMQLVTSTLCHQESSPTANSAISSETATASCPAEPIAWSRASRVIQEVDSTSTAANKAAGVGPLIVEVSRCAPPALSIRQDQRGSVAEVNNNDEKGVQSDADQSWLLGGGEGEDEAATASTVSSTATVSVPTDTSAGHLRVGERLSADCRLCTDFAPYARSRLNDLKRSGLKLGVSRPGRNNSGEVSVQRSGFSRPNTAFIADLVSRAADKFHSDAELASHVRLELRRLGFECAVVIGRQFTGCICGQESSRLLMDIGERTCLIFSFFHLTGDLNKRVPMLNS